MQTQENRYQKKILTIPNILSFFRLLLIPVILWLYIGKGERLWATAVLVLSGVTDIVDGQIARRCHMVSDFGKALDPVADKLTQITVLCCLVTDFPHMTLPLILLVLKEVTAGIISLIVIHKTGNVYGAVWHGKAATVLLYGAMILHLLWPAIPTVLSAGLCGACVTMLLISAFLYGKQNLQAIKKHQGKADQ